MTEAAPLVSIALCTCNGEAHLRQQLDSLVHQDHPDLEIVVLDDASADSTWQIVKAYAERHPMIRANRNESRLGVVANFQKCMELCRGNFIALCDQDDVWFPHKISTMLAAIGDKPMAYSRVRVVDSQGNPLAKVHPNRKLLQGRCPLALVLTNFVTGHASMIRRDLLAKALPVPEGHLHDHWLAFCAACSGQGIVLVDEVLSDYRLHQSNLILGASKPRGQRPRPEHLMAYAEHPGLNAEQASMVRQLASLMGRPFALFNFKLRRFLKEHEASFLAAYHRPGRVRHKLCMRHVTANREA